MTNVTLYQTLFDVQVTLCDRFYALSPLELRRTPIHELCVLLERMQDHARRENRTRKNAEEIRRPARDTWF